jgi:hypothetical protein
VSNQYTDTTKFELIANHLDVEIVLKDALGDFVGDAIYKRRYGAGAERFKVGNYLCPRARLRVFAQVGTTCAICGLQGKWVNIYKHVDSDIQSSPIHAVVVGVKSDGSEEPLTLDHIIPVSQGGKSVSSNYRPMCADCNVIRACSPIEQVKEIHSQRMKFLERDRKKMQEYLSYVPTDEEIPNLFDDISHMIGIERKTKKKKKHLSYAPKTEKVPNLFDDMSHIFQDHS